MALDWQNKGNSSIQAVATVGRSALMNEWFLRLLRVGLVSQLD